MTIRNLIVAIMLAALVLPFAVPEGFAQDQRPRRSLFEVLFGSGSQPEPQPQAPARQAPAPAPRASLPPPPAEVQKAETAKRVAVFGDSLAVDLALAMNRFYAEDPETLVIGQGVGSSGFVRDDFFDWNAALDAALAADSFDIAVVAVGINDRQAIAGAAPLTDDWKDAYSARLDRFLAALRARGKPAIWIELPPMEQPRYSADMVQISALHRAAVQAAGGEWVETYERYMSEAGGYAAMGPDLNGQIVSMRKSDGIHFSNAGSDKLAFYIDRALRLFHAGSLSIEVADILAGTDAADMLRPPFQGLGQIRLVEMAGIVQPMGEQSRRADDFIVAGRPASDTRGFALEAMLAAPVGRVDAFGLGIAPAGGGRTVENRTGR